MSKIPDEPLELADLAGLVFHPAHVKICKTCKLDQATLDQVNVKLMNWEPIRSVMEWLGDRLGDISNSSLYNHACALRIWDRRKHDVTMPLMSVIDEGLDLLREGKLRFTAGDLIRAIEVMARITKQLGDAQTSNVLINQNLGQLEEIAKETDTAALLKRAVEIRNRLEGMRVSAGRGGNQGDPQPDVEDAEIVESTERTSGESQQVVEPSLVATPSKKQRYWSRSPKTREKGRRKGLTAQSGRYVSRKVAELLGLPESRVRPKDRGIHGQGAGRRKLEDIPGFVIPPPLAKENP